jgi:hypothetical protein
MNAFESLVSAILQSRGFWTLATVKVKLTKEEKKAVGRPTMPRWELDIVGFKPKGNCLLIVECKSYLDSAGVDPRALFEKGHKYAKRYKLFTEEETRRVVFEALIRQLREKGLLSGTPKPKLCLAAGRIIPTGRNLLKDEFKARGWDLYDLEWIRQGLREIALDGYENSIVSIAAKLLNSDSA